MPAKINPIAKNTVIIHLNNLTMHLFTNYFPIPLYIFLFPMKYYYDQLRYQKKYTIDPLSPVRLKAAYPPPAYKIKSGIPNALPT